MKSKLIPTCGIFTILLCLYACSSDMNVPAPEQVFIDVSYAGKQVEIAVDGTLAVTLECNPKIGLKWLLKNISDQTVLKLVNQKFEPPENEATVGSEGTEIWTFKTLEKGKSNINMEYRQPWQKQFPPEKTFVLTVVVK